MPIVRPHRCRRIAVVATLCFGLPFAAQGQPATDNRSPAAPSTAGNAPPAPPMVRAGAAVVANHTSTGIRFRLAGETGKIRDYALSPTMVAPLPAESGMRIEYAHRGQRHAIAIEPHGVYLFVAPQGQLKLEQVDFRGSATDPPTAGRAAVAAPPVRPTRGDLAQGVVSVRLLVDEDQPGAQTYWERRLRPRVEECSAILQQHCGLRLEINGLGTWQSNDRLTTLEALREDFARKAPLEGARLAIGFTSQPLMVPPGELHAAATERPLASHLLLPDVSQSPTQDGPVELLLHAVGHWLGATHSPEITSAMRPDAAAPEVSGGPRILGFDAINTMILCRVAEELVTRGIDQLPELSADARRQIANAYAIIADAMPEDAVVGQIQEGALQGTRPSVASPQTAGPAGTRVAETQQVLAAILRAAEINDGLRGPQVALDAPQPLERDHLATLYYRAAAQAATELPPERAAATMLLALGIGMDSSNLLRTNVLYGDLYRQVEAESARRYRLGILGEPTLAGRADLLQHFAISGLLTVLSGGATAETAGVFKEISDSRGGSGFSFADLLADLAGIRFAQFALRHPDRLAELGEKMHLSAFMPSIDGLREGLEWAAFARAYGSTSDQRFSTELRGLRRRLSQLPVYAGEPEEPKVAQTAPAAPDPQQPAAPPDPRRQPPADEHADRLRDLQTAAMQAGRAPWGFWGHDPARYSGWQRHSNRLIPVYTFGISLGDFKADHSPYRSQQRLQELYGRMPEGTFNPAAEYFDQTDIYRLQRAAAAQGKKHIVLVVFDGMDWQTTWAAATYQAGRVAYREGRGTGLAFQDYRGTETDFGFFVTSAAQDGSKYSVDDQVLVLPGDASFGGYDPVQAGPSPWQAGSNPEYLLGRSQGVAHLVTDSAASATSLCSGVKTYNVAINVDALGGQTVPIARQLQQQGFSIGVVTSVPVSHATPACAYANNVERNDYQDLSRDLLGLPSVAHKQELLPGVDVLIGTGWGTQSEREEEQGRNFVPGNPILTSDDLSLIDVAQGGPYRVVQRQSGVKGTNALLDAARQAADAGQRLFGFFGLGDDRTGGKFGPHLPFRTADGRYDPTLGAQGTREIYTPADIEENPTLADMTRAALTVLERDPDGFWLMVEAGDVDWANHDNNLDNSIGAVTSGDEAFQAVVQWVERRQAWKDTVVIVTADHGHSLWLVEPEALVATPPAAETAKTDNPNTETTKTDPPAAAAPAGEPPAAPPSSKPAGNPARP